MRLLLFCVCVIAAGIVGAQTKVTKDNLGLVGDRFKPLTYNEMTPEQKTMVDHMLAGERGGMGGPFNVLLRSPEMGDLGQQLGARMRFHSALPGNVRETVIILTARWWMSQYEWTAHKRLALQEGVNPAVVNAIAAGKRPAAMDPKTEVAYNFVTELYKTRQASDATYQAAKSTFGERGVVDIIMTVGYYQVVSMGMNVDRFPLGQGQQPELKYMARPLP